MPNSRKGNCDMPMNYTEHPLYPLFLNFAQRSLLGVGKGTFVIDQLKTENPAFYKAVMDEALLLQKDNISKETSIRIMELFKLTRDNVEEYG